MHYLDNFKQVFVRILINQRHRKDSEFGAKSPPTMIKKVVASGGAIGAADDV